MNTDDFDDLTSPHPSEHLDALREFLQVFGRDANLLSACMDLRMRANGAADPPYSDEEVRRRLRSLQARLNTWTPSAPDRSRFDNAVRGLVQATIIEVRARLAPHPDHQKHVEGLLTLWNTEEGRTKLAALLVKCGAREGVL